MYRRKILRGVRCPKCGTQVKRTERTIQIPDGIRRHRKCVECTTVFATTEKIRTYDDDLSICVAKLLEAAEPLSRIAAVKRLMECRDSTLSLDEPCEPKPNPDPSN
jgi:transcriptional regulator NrdR family protein